MKILITGASGQLGFQIQKMLGQKYDLILTDYKEMDITNKLQVHQVMKSSRPDWIIHGAAYTKVDQAEDEVDTCTKINANGTKNLAETAADFNIPIIYISTDYVFDGKFGRENGVRSKEQEFKDKIPHYASHPAPYTELDVPHPLNVYGKTKLDGEKYIQNICKKYYILRVAWLFGELPENYSGTNFIETMLRLSKERDALSVVNDQIGSPTYTKDLVKIIDKIVGSRQSAVGSESQSANRQPQTANQLPVPYGIYHFSGDGECSWYDFAKTIFHLTKTNIDLKPTTSDRYPQKAKRPAYTYMSKAKIEKVLDLSVRSWQYMVKEYLNNKK